VSPEVVGPAPPKDRPGNPVATKQLDNAIVPPDADEIPQQLRRRREASLRMPPLADGRRDPWDLYPRDGAAR
jgi:hypothetical protein